MNRRLLVGLVLWGLAPVRAIAEDSPLSLADLAVYRTALSRTREKEESAVSVTFRDLWDRPETYQGRLVIVTGRVVRRFRQGKIGEFPPLEEAWAVSTTGDPFCLVFPAQSEKRDLPPNRVRFVGTFLRKIRYQAGDVPRVAPLIVGGHSPDPVDESRLDPPGVPVGNHARLDLAVGITVALAVTLVLAGQYARKPPRSHWERDLEIAPPFVSDVPGEDNRPTSGDTGPEYEEQDSRERS